MNPYQNLLFRRQFIFCKKEVNEFAHWNHYKINDYTLLTHPDLNVSSIKEHEKEIYLLGSLFDYKNKYATDETILKNLIQSGSFDELIKKIEDYCGRYVLIFKQGNSLKMLNDVSAKRKVVYYSNGKDFCCASQAKLIAKCYNLKKSEKAETIEYYNSDGYYSHRKVGVLDRTEYINTKQLIANWYLDINKHEAKRFWPYRKLEPIPLNKAIFQVSEILSGFMHNIHQRENLMIGVTAGNDSRLILAASKDISKDVFYYINYLPWMSSENHPDIYTYKRIMNKLKLKTNIIKVPDDVNRDFREIYFKNNEYAEQKNLSLIYHFFLKKCTTRINVASTMSDVTRNYLSTFRSEITPELLVKMFYHDDLSYVKKIYGEWLKGVKPLAKELNYNILDLFSWEERVTNLGAYYARDNDLAKDEVSPLACRKVIEIMLSVPKDLRDVHTNIFQRALIKNMWPELDEIPYNPRLLKRISYNLKMAKVYWLVRGIVRGW